MKDHIKDLLDHYFDEEDVVDVDAYSRVVLLSAPQKRYQFGPRDQFQDQAEYIRLLTNAYPTDKIGVSTRELMSADDLRVCLNEIAEINEAGLEADDVAPVDMIHFVGHGTADGISFPNGDFLRLTTKKDRELFNNLGSPYLLFSCCGLGKKRGMINKLATESDSKIVFAYRSDLLAHEAFLIDSMIYHILFGQVVGRYMSAAEKCLRISAVVEAGLVYHKGPGGGADPLVWSTGDR